MGLLTKIKSFVKSQPSRIKNVGSTFAAIGKNVASVVGLSKPTKITANVKNPIVKKGLEIVANNPFKTALVGGTIANIPKVVSAVKNSRKVKPKGNDVQITGTNQAPGMLDVNSLGTPKGGLLTKAKETVTGSTTTTTTGSSSVGTSSPRRRRSKKSRSKRSKSRRSRTSRKKRSGRSYGTAKQYARKGGKSVKYTKNGQPYIILSDGRARFVKGRRKK